MTHIFALGQLVCRRKLVVSQDVQRKRTRGVLIHDATINSIHIQRLSVVGLEHSPVGRIDSMIKLSLLNSIINDNVQIRSTGKALNRHGRVFFNGRARNNGAILNLIALFGICRFIKNVRTIRVLLNVMLLEGQCIFIVRQLASNAPTASATTSTSAMAIVRVFFFM